MHRDPGRARKRAGTGWERVCAQEVQGSTGTGPRGSGRTTRQRTRVHTGSEGCFQKAPSTRASAMVLCVCSSSLSRRALQGEVRSQARAHRASQPQGQNVSGHRVCTAETARWGTQDGKVFTSPSRPWTTARLPLRWRPRHSSASLHNSLVARTKAALLPGDSTFTEHLRPCPVGGVDPGDGGAGGAERGQGGRAGCVWWSDGGWLLPGLTRKCIPTSPPP